MAISENQRRADMRKNPRVETTDQVAVINTHSGDVVGQLVNLSVDGLMLMGPNCIAPGTVLQLRVPIGDGDKTSELLVGAEALWCQDANDSGSYWSGFQIIDISPEQQEMLDALVGD
jgi:hypothetical protein